MARGRGRQTPDHPDAVWSELEEDEQLAVESFAATLKVPTHAWPELDELLGIVVPVACARRIERLQAAGVGVTAAITDTAEAFGLSVASVRQAHYRRNERALEVRVRARERIHSSVTDTTAGTA